MNCELNFSYSIKTIDEEILDETRSKLEEIESFLFDFDDWVRINCVISPLYEIEFSSITVKVSKEGEITATMSQILIPGLKHNINTFEVDLAKDDFETKLKARVLEDWYALTEDEIESWKENTEENYNEFFKIK